MRSILEKAIVHLLNEDNAKAEALFHKFIVEKARKIHESLRQGDEETDLADGWDDETHSDEYMSDADVSDAETDAGDDAGVDDAADDVATDLGDDAAADDVDADEDDEDADADALEGDDEGADTDERLGDIEDQIAALTSEFEEMMSKVSGDDDDDEDSENPFASGSDDDDDDAEEDDADAEEDLDDAEDDVEDAEDDEADADEDEDEDDDDDLDDITESVIAELEKVSVSMDDGREIGAGKGITTNKQSNLPSNNVNNRGGAAPIRQKSTDHTGFERETAPGVKDQKTGRNSKKSASEFTSQVPAGGDKSALLHKDFAGGAKATKPVLDN